MDNPPFRPRASACSLGITTHGLSVLDRLLHLPAFHHLLRAQLDRNLEHAQGRETLGPHAVIIARTHAQMLPVLSTSVTYTRAGEQFGETRVWVVPEHRFATLWGSTVIPMR